MTSLQWYIGLTAISVAIAVYAIYKKRHIFKISTLVVFYLFSATITWFGEFLVLGIFDSYAYKPGLFPDQWAEDLLGHLLLNTSMFPAAAILTVTYSLSYRGIFLISAAFVLSEYLFVHLGIYEQHWWRYYMSGINTVAFLLIARSWFAKVKHPQHNIPRLFTCYFVAFILVHTPTPLLLLMEKQYYTMELIRNFIGNMYRTSIIIIFSYHMVEVALLILFVCVLDKWYWKVVPFVIACAGQSILAKIHILNFQNGWKLIYLLLLYFISLSAFMLIEKYALRPDR